MEEVKLIKLKDIRTSKGMTQSELAKLTGVSTRQIIRYEREESGASLEYAIRIASCLGVETDKLIGKKICLEAREESISKEDSIVLYTYAKNNLNRINQKDKDAYKWLLEKFCRKKQYTKQEAEDLIFLLGNKYYDFIRNKKIIKKTKKNKMFKKLYFEYLLCDFSLEKMPSIMRYMLIGMLLLGMVVYSTAYVLAPQGGLVQTGLELVRVALLFGLAAFALRIAAIVINKNERDNSTKPTEYVMWYGTYFLIFLFWIILVLGLLCMYGGLLIK